MKCASRAAHGPCRVGNTPLVSLEVAREHLLAGRSGRRQRPKLVLHRRLWWCLRAFVCGDLPSRRLGQRRDGFGQSSRHRLVVAHQGADNPVSELTTLIVDQPVHIEGELSDQGFEFLLDVHRPQDSNAGTAR